MKSKQHSLQGTVKGIAENEIFLNISYLDDGRYRLNIVYRNKIIKQTSFKKKQEEEPL